MIEPKKIVEKQNSFIFRYGGTATDIKIYFENAKDLKIQLLDLKRESMGIKEEMSEIKSLLGEV